MFYKTRLISALLAGLIAVSSVCAAMPSAYAAEEDEKIEMTFDGAHRMKDRVGTIFFQTRNTSEVQENLEKAIANTVGKEKIYDITFEDLAKISYLSLSDMELTDVPTCINYMVNLSWLDLSGNLLRSDTLKKLSLHGCTKLSNIDISDNYLTTMPSWFVSDRVILGDISQNFVDSQNPRFIESAIPTYYFMDGEALNEDYLKNQILKSIRLNNGMQLPEVFFKYNSIRPPYPKPAGADYTLDITDWTALTDTEGKVVAPENNTITVTVQLFKDDENDKTKTTVTIYLLSGKDLPSIKKRLEGLKTECEALTNDDYTTSSWENFTQAKDTADAILKYENADVQMLANALDALTKARDNLQYGTKDLKEMLAGLITVGNTYKQENYTPSSWTDFSDALEEIKKIAADTNATLEAAQIAVKEFQRAQAALSFAELVVPDIIPKSEFEKIYGEDRNLTASGVTRAGTPYKWSFYGKDLKETADFNPEVKDSDDNESGILIEAGSNSGYRMFVTAADKAFPGKATLEIDVSDKFISGDFYLYKWNASAKRSIMAGNATVTDGTARIPLSEGGVYYLCPNVQNFELKSQRYEVDNNKKTILIPPTSGVSVFNFKNSFDFGTYTTVLDTDENEVSSTSRIKTGMTINAPNMDKYSIVLIGDVNKNGIFELRDVSVMIDNYMNDTEIESLQIYDMNGDSRFNLKDVNLTIEYYMSM